MECPESLKFHWNYKLFSTWPPKYPILLKYTKNTKFPHFCSNSTKKSSKVRKRWFLKIWADFHDSRADSPLQNLCNSLGFPWSGQVSCVPWGAGTGFCNFSVIHGNSWNSHNIMEFLEISLKIRNPSKFSEFCIFEATHPPESLIFLRNYRCFRDPAIFTEISIFIKKVRICAKIINLAFSPFQQKVTFCGKWVPGHRKAIKRDGIPLVL